MLPRETRKRSATTSHCTCCNSDQQCSSSEVKQRKRNLDKDSLEHMDTENLMDTQFGAEICDILPMSSAATNMESELPSRNNILNNLNPVSYSSTFNSNSVPGAHIKLVKSNMASKNIKSKKGKHTVTAAPATTLVVQSLPKTLTSSTEFPTQAKTKHAKKKKGISAANRTKKSQNKISTINMGAVAYSGPQLQQHSMGQDCGMDMAISTIEGRHLAFSQQPHYTVTSPDTEQGHSNIPQPQQFTAVATPYGYHGHLGLVQSQPHVAAVTPTTLQGQLGSPHQPNTAWSTGFQNNHLSHTSLGLQNESTHLPVTDTSSDESSASSDEGDLNLIGQNYVQQQYMPLQGMNIGSTQSQYVEPISTPISQQVPKKIKKKIWKNQYIDLGTLLPRTTITNISNTNFSLQLTAKSQLSLVPNQNIKKIYNIEQWTTAFIRFTAIYTEQFPLESPQLLKYAEIVRDLAKRNPGQAWLVYDQQFRMLRENHMIPWDRLHTEFWVMSANHYSPLQSRQTKMPFRSFRTNRFSQGSNRNPKFIELTCWTYNRRGFCGEPWCKYQHRCGYCKGPHPASRCRPTRTTSQQSTT